MNTFSREEQVMGVSEGEKGENMRNRRAISYEKGLTVAPGGAGIWSFIWLQEGS